MLHKVIPMPTSIIFVKEGKFPNKCDFCKDTIPAGSPSYWEKGGKRNWHKNCYELNVKPQAHPSVLPNQDASMTGKHNQVSSPDRLASPVEAPAQAVQRMLKESIAIVLKEIPDAGELHDYPILIAETLRALSYKESQKFEMELTAIKIKAYGKVGA